MAGWRTSALKGPSNIYDFDDTSQNEMMEARIGGWNTAARNEDMSLITLCTGRATGEEEDSKGTCQEAHSVHPPLR